jgi:phosphatidylinositol-3-phosphatase
MKQSRSVKRMLTIGFVAFVAFISLATVGTGAAQRPTCHLRGKKANCDTTRPNAPTSLSVTAATTSSVTLAWSGANDNVGVTGYDVFLNGTKVNSTTQTSYTFTGLNCGTSYAFGVDAYDAAGNRSSVTTATAAASSCPTDTTPPNPPTSLSVTAATTSSVTLAWSGANDNVGVTGYDVFLNGTKVNSTPQTSYTFMGLNCGTSYTVGVKAYDAAGNRSTEPTIGAATAACPPPPPPGPCGTSTAMPATLSHVIWIWMENHSYSEIIGSSSAPYENQLANECGLATNYTAVTHPSLPNYIAATSGSTQGITDDADPSSHPLNVNSIFGQVGAGNAGSYEESMPSNCYLTGSGTYAVKHNPEAYYTPIRTQCAIDNVPMGTTSSGNFLTALTSTTLRKFSFVTPNLCNDMHDCSIATGDAWLKSWVPVILASPAYKAGTTALFISFDEDDGSAGNRVATIVVSPYTRVGVRSSTAFNHYSLLRTTEELLGIGTYLGNAASATSMRSAFFG